MPRYDYECGRCNRTEERVFRIGKATKTVKCECGGRAHRVFNKAPAGHVFGGGSGKEHVYEHIDGIPHRVGSKRELAEIVKYAAEKENTTIRMPYHDIVAEC